MPLPLNAFIPPVQGMACWPPEETCSCEEAQDSLPTNLCPSHGSHSNPGHWGNRFPKHCHKGTAGKGSGPRCAGGSASGKDREQGPGALPQAPQQPSLCSLPQKYQALLGKAHQRGVTMSVHQNQLPTSWWQIPRDRERGLEDLTWRCVGTLSSENQDALGPAAQMVTKDQQHLQH